MQQRAPNFHLLLLTTPNKGTIIHVAIYARFCERIRCGVPGQILLAGFGLPPHASATSQQASRTMTKVLLDRVVLSCSFDD